MDRQKRNEYCREWRNRPENKERWRIYVREKTREWRKNNPEKVKELGRKNYRAMSQQKKKELVERNRRRRATNRLKAISFYGGKCACCGESQIEFLCIDHINGGGNKHRKTMTTKSIGDWLYSNNYPEGFQVLCFNCNSAKSAYKKCPHQK